MHDSDGEALPRLVSSSSDASASDVDYEGWSPYTSSSSEEDRPRRLTRNEGSRFRPVVISGPTQIMTVRAMTTDLSSDNKAA